MIRVVRRKVFNVPISLARASCSHFANSQTQVPQTDNSTASEVLKKLDQLVEQNRQLEKQNQELMDQIVSYRQVLAKQAGSVSQVPDKVKEPTPSTGSAEEGDSQRSKPSQAAVSPVTELYKCGAYSPNLGYKVANTDHGDLSISIYSYARYLNQLGLDATYKDAFGHVESVQQRQDFQLQKVQIKFLGWVMDPNKSAVGYTSVPFALGCTGPAFSHESRVGLLRSM
jgi:hypothetical protein